MKFDSSLILRWLFRSFCLVILIPLVLLGFWSAWYYLTTDLGEERAKYILEEEEKCLLLGDEKRINDCTEQVYMAIGGGDVLLFIASSFGLTALLILVFLIVSWRKK